jgi:hypothetical protein
VRKTETTNEGGLAWHNLIYKLWQAKFKETWHQLGQEEQQRRLAKVQAALPQVGAKGVLLCESAWANEQWSFFGVEEFPDIEAVQRHTTPR